MVPIFPQTSANGVCTCIALDPDKVAETTPGLDRDDKPTVKEFEKEFRGGIEDLMGSIMSFVRVCTVSELDIY